jgi:hypothetical protein
MMRRSSSDSRSSMVDKRLLIAASFPSISTIRFGVAYAEVVKDFE